MITIYLVKKALCNVIHVCREAITLIERYCAQERVKRKYWKGWKELNKNAPLEVKIKVIADIEGILEQDVRAWETEYIDSRYFALLESDFI